MAKTWLLFSIIASGGLLQSWAGPRLGFKSCPHGSFLVEKPEGSICVKDLRSMWITTKVTPDVRRVPMFTTTTTTSTTRPAAFGFDFGFGPEPSVGKPARTANVGSGGGGGGKVFLPENEAQIDMKEKRCFEMKKVLWPADGQCYSLLQQGPCRSDEWLVAQEVNEARRNRIQILCQKPACPCTSEFPDLCEVSVKRSYDSCPKDRCYVALAAEQDLICAKGEQLLLSPFGFGVCGCRPDHVTLEDVDPGRCFELYTQGPCSSNRTLQFSSSQNKALCTPNLCPFGYVLHDDDGKCYVLNSRGPCDDLSHWVLDKESKKPHCQILHKYQRRVFDLVQSPPRSMTGRFASDTVNCPSMTGKCRPTEMTVKAAPPPGSSPSGRVDHWPSSKTNRDSPQGSLALPHMSKAGTFLHWLLSFRSRHVVLSSAI